MKSCVQFPELLQAFFTERLMHQRQASPHTIASYRDTFRLLVKFAQQRLRKEPSVLAIEDFGAPFVGSFLNYLENDRHVTSRSRNVRLAAIHSFFRYVALNEPSHSALAQRVLAIPSKRFDRRPIGFLTRLEVEALLAVPDQDTWGGRRDRALFLTAVQTGLRVSELVGLRCQDVVLGPGAHVRCRGKGRKERCTPLRKEAAAALRAWLRERTCSQSEPLFPNAKGGWLTRDGVEYLLAKHVAMASQQYPSLRKKRITAHLLRHYLPFRIMSRDEGCYSAQSRIAGRSADKTRPIARHSFWELLETVQEA